MNSPDLPTPFGLLPKAALRAMKFCRNESIFHQRDPASAIYFLKTGAIELQRHSETGDRITIHRARPGETFAEASLFSDGYHCDARVTKDSLVVRIERRILLDRFRTDAVFALAIASRFAHQVQTARRLTEILTVRGAEKRVMDAVRDGLLDTDIKTFAATIGLTHEATYRALSKLSREGSLVKTGRGRYRIA